MCDAHPRSADGCSGLVGRSVGADSAHRVAPTRPAVLFGCSVNRPEYQPVFVATATEFLELGGRFEGANRPIALLWPVAGVAGFLALRCRE